MSEEEQNVNKLLSYQKELLVEEEWLKKMISKLNAQAHALQVEQLHILNAMNKKSRESTPIDTTSNATTTVPLKTETTETQQLDLTVPNYQSSEEDEDDEMEY